jgi:Uncharacterized conserved protein (DUF2304)
VAIDRVQVVALTISVVLLLVVLELVRRRKLVEEYSFLWIGSALVLVALSASRYSLDVAARWLGVFYPPIILVMMLILIVFAASLWFCVIVSKQRQQIERLIEDTAVLAAELRDLKALQEDREPWAAALNQEDSRPAPKRPSA